MGYKRNRTMVPMCLRPLSLLLVCLLSTGLSGQDAPVVATPPPPTPSVRVQATITKLNAEGKPDVLSAPSVTVLSGNEAKVAVAGKMDPKTNKPEGGLECLLTPTVSATGEITLAFRVVVFEAKPAPTDPKTEKRERKRESKQHDGTLVFYSALPSQGLFSIQDAKGARRWYKIGSVVDSWKLDSYDDEKQQLLVSQGATHQELRLYKSSIEASASELSTVVTMRSGETVRVPGVAGLEVSLNAVVIPGVAAK